MGITLDDKLVERIDDFADKNYMSRSGFFTLASVSYLNSAELVGYMRDLSLCMRKIADTGTVDHETMEQLEDLERVAKLFSSSFKT